MTSPLVADRGKQYGHPRDHFTRTVGILAIVFGDRQMNTLRPQDWAVVMQCDKLARFAETLDHADSQKDLAGYSETWFLAQEESFTPGRKGWLEPETKLLAHDSSCGS